MLTEVVLQDQCQRTVPCVKRPGSRCSSIAYLQGQRVGKYIPWKRMASHCHGRIDVLCWKCTCEHVGEGLTNRKDVIGHSARLDSVIDPKVRGDGSGSQSLQPSRGIGARIPFPFRHRAEKGASRLLRRGTTNTSYHDIGDH